MPKVSYQQSSRRVELKIDSHPANLASTRRAIEAFGGGCGFDKSAIEDIGLCVNEALANVIRHAYDGATDKPIVVSAVCNPDSMTITIRDWGTGVEPPKNLPSKKCDPLTPGGIGLICLQQMMDEVVFAPQPGGGMLLTMTRRKNSVKRREQKRDVG